MSTNSRIGRFYPATENVKSIYAHWDGYPEPPGNGSILLQHYTTTEKVDKLIELGHISSLAATIEKTIAYHRDRGEPKAKNGPDIHPHFEWPDNYGYIEWEYVWEPTPGRWLARPLDWDETEGVRRASWEPLSIVVERENRRVEAMS